MKNCLVVLKNKKLSDDTVSYTPCERAFASAGFYFDKIAVIGYDSSKDIVCQLKECREGFENTLIFCPSRMETTLKQFIEQLYGSRFDMAKMLETSDRTVFLRFYDGNNAISLEEITAYIGKKFGYRYGKSYIKAVGAPENEVVEVVEKAKAAYPGLNCNVYSDCGDCTIEIIYSQDEPKMLLDDVVRILLGALDKYVYALEDITLAQRLFQLLKLRRMKICVAESFTGGGVGQKLVEVPGISEVYFEGLNTYSNEAKTSRLGVDEYTIKSKGAVSAETAKEMAEGLISQGNCDVAISTTGIAGPKSDNSNKPVGLCYIAVALKDRTSVNRFVLKGDRQTITRTAINYALFLAYKQIK
ncbi:MAG: CinA family protein [Clostridia bacterium]|nr:CinA family protein [Clostridia bacterium]